MIGIGGIMWQLISMYQANNGGYRTTDPARTGAPAVSIQPIEVPSLSVDELKDVTDNFGTKALIGDGSYGRVYYGVLRSGRDATMSCITCCLDVIESLNLNPSIAVYVFELEFEQV